MSAILIHHRWMLQFLSIVMIFSLNVMEQCWAYVKDRCIISVLKVYDVQKVNAAFILQDLCVLFLYFIAS